MRLEEFHSSRSDATHGTAGQSPLSDERMHEECGLVGIFYPHEDVANLTYFGLYALQHRGQESAGIGVSDGREMRMHKEMGLVSQVFDQEALDDLHGHIAIGQPRYSTTGSTRLPHAPPMPFEHPIIGPFLLAHNGNLVNSTELRDELQAQGVELETTSDTEVLGLMLSHTPGDTLDQVLAATLPARRATRIAPVAALAEALPETQELPKRRIIAGAVILVAGVACLIGGLYSGSDSALQLIGAGFLCFAGFVSLCEGDDARLFAGSVG